MDPFSGSGTFPIEAALIGMNIAPGVNREFTAASWEKLMTKKMWYDAYDEARSLEKPDTELHIQGYDIDPEIVKCARTNAIEAGVGDKIHFQARPVAELRNPKPYGFIITNPPYGERLEDRETLPAIYSDLGRAYAQLDNWSMYLITSWDETEEYIGRKADKNRKIYNGMIQARFYSFMGGKPPKKDKK